MAILASTEQMRRASEESEPVKESTPGLAFYDLMFEQVDIGAFVVYDRRKHEIQVINDPWYTYTHQGVKYIPLARLPWPTAHLPRLYGSEEELYKEIRDFFAAHLDVANDLLFDVFASFVMASWRPEDFKVVPYLFFLGPLASGKTRALECFQRLCYRSIMAASISAASIFRTLEAWHPTLLLDETEIYRSEGMREVIGLLNTGYRRGQYAIRMEKVSEGSPQIAMFDTFGFKVMAGTEELAATLQSRCILTTMSKAVRPINLFIDEDKAEDLRNKLLMYRFQTLGEKLRTSPEQLEKINNYIQNARVIELFISLIQVAPKEAKQRLLKCMKQISQSRLDEEQASIEARVFDAIKKSESLVDDGKISTQSITEAFNQGLTEKEQVTSRFIGRKVAALGFEKCRVGSAGRAGYFWDNNLIERLKKRYYPSGTTSETSETSEILKTMEEKVFDTEVSEEINLAKTGAETHEKPMITDVSEVSEDNRRDPPKLSAKSGVRFADLKSVYWSDGFYNKHTCAMCGDSKMTSWQAETFHDKKVWICEDCKTIWEKREDE
ncbi:MAG: hypothetical protein PVH12_02675 [Candidatus Bathyarchaeota archaeon]|jgi:hypothetical protein